MLQLSDEDFNRIAALIKAEVSGSEARLNDRIVQSVAESEDRVLHKVDGLDGRISSLEARLDSFEARILHKVDSRLEAFEARILHKVDGRLDALEARILHKVDGRLDALEARLNDRIAQSADATTTSLLTAFHQWASPMEARMRTHAATLRALDLENEYLSDRVTKLENPEKPQ